MNPGIWPREQRPAGVSMALLIAYDDAIYRHMPFQSASKQVQIAELEIDLACDLIDTAWFSEIR